ncbi:MAG: hypothetical protein SPI86_02275 [Treponemataceae bacterium]|nr:hypothetical protein [Spirochaetales bacterium]MDY6030568.1 hypothetical protein [Treponemataceae bacterium]
MTILQTKMLGGYQIEIGYDDDCHCYNLCVEYHGSPSLLMSYKTLDEIVNLPDEEIIEMAKTKISLTEQDMAGFKAAFLKNFNNFGY